MKYLIILFSLLTLFTNCHEEPLPNLDLIGTWKHDSNTYIENGRLKKDTFITNHYLVMGVSEGCYDSVCLSYRIQQHDLPIIWWEDGSSDTYSRSDDKLTISPFPSDMQLKRNFTRQ